jgi:hypothetical protein
LISAAAIAPLSCERRVSVALGCGEQHIDLLRIPLGYALDRHPRCAVQLHAS